MKIRASSFSNARFLYQLTAFSLFSAHLEHERVQAVDA
jgi:hypothetical protein